MTTRQQRRAAERKHLKLVKDKEFDDVVNAESDRTQIEPPTPPPDGPPKAFEALQGDDVGQMTRMGGGIVLTTLDDEDEPDKVFRIAQGAKYGVAQITKIAMQQLHLDHIPVDCGPRCSYCCYLQVAASPVECLYIARELRRTLSPEKLLEVTEQLRLVALRVRSMTHDEREGAHVPCGLLDDGRCLTYNARPLSCLGWTSKSRHDCEAAFQGKTHGSEIAMFGPLFVACTAVGAGVLLGLKERGLDDTGVELNGGVLIALETPDAEARWLAGEQLFASAAINMEEGAPKT